MTFKMIADKGGRGRGGGPTIRKDVMSIRGRRYPQASHGKNFLEIWLSKTSILVHYKVEINQITWKIIWLQLNLSLLLSTKGGGGGVGGREYLPRSEPFCL